MNPPHSFSFNLIYSKFSDLVVIDYLNSGNYHDDQILNTMLHKLLYLFGISTDQQSVTIQMRCNKATIMS